MCGEVKNGTKRNCNSKRWLIPWDEDEGEGVLPWRSGESGAEGEMVLAVEIGRIGSGGEMGLAV